MKRILLIDKEPGWIRFVTQNLSSQQWEVVVASDFSTAHTELKADNFALVIAGSSYFDILSDIQANFPSERVMVVTVQPSIQEAREAFKLGALRYETKSFDSQSLFARVDEVISPKDVPEILAT